MSSPSPRFHPRRRGHDDDPVMAELARRIPRSDMTEPIMARLGFTRSGPRDARKRRLRRLLSRGGLGAASAMVLVLSVHLHKSTAPAGASIPSAIQHDLKHHEHTIQQAIRTIRSLLPQRPASPPAPDAAEPDPVGEEAGSRPAQPPGRWA